MAIQIKQSATLLMALEFTEEEWSVLFPNGTEVLACQAKMGSVRIPLTLNRHNDLRTLIIRSDTIGWPLGQVKIDVRVTRDGFSYYVPQLSNFNFTIIEGVTQP